MNILNPRVPLCIVLLMAVGSASAQLADPWRTEYTGKQASGDAIIGLWQFNQPEIGADSSGNGHAAKLDGGTIVKDGRFHSALASGRGWPEIDEPHAAIVADADDLSPAGAFTIDLWIRPTAELEGYPESFLIDKKYVSDHDYQLILGRAKGDGRRTLRAELGFGDDSASWYADAAEWKTDTWYHVAFTYDGAGTGSFFRNGRFLGQTTHEGRGAISPGPRNLSIGDRVGSLYHGFPGALDQVRLSHGVREFRPIMVQRVGSPRRAYIRMEDAPILKYSVRNLESEKLSGIVVTASTGGVNDKTYKLPPLDSGTEHVIEYPINTSLRPDRYEIELTVKIPSHDYQSQETFPLSIVPRPRPFQMPVVMWGVGGFEHVVKEIDRLKKIGFTHCLGLRADYGKIWEAGKPVPPADEEQLAAGHAMLDAALENNLGIIISLSPGRWYFDRQDEDDPRGIAEQLPRLIQFCHDIGVSVANAWGDYPAFDAALIHTEVRGHSQVNFAKSDRQAFREATGLDIPEELLAKQGDSYLKRGVDYRKLENFPENRVIPDDHPIYRFYQWFWRQGDGWNRLHTALHKGLTSAAKEDFWTFHDPAVRVPSIFGSGGEVDFLSQWTYSYPDPIRIGIATDELLAMAAGASVPQKIMKMTQIIWYRSQTAPAPDGARPEDWGDSVWEDTDPDAAFITIAPMHLREAFWTKIARPVQGIMYHGWQSLVPTDGTSSYRYTHPDTRRELARLVKTVVEPLGPMLLQVPKTGKEVAFLESFASQMFARRGTYGWGRGWGGDAYLAMQYAQLQPEIIFDETILNKGLKKYKVLVMVDCDVITQGMLEEIQKFQKRGGIVVGDERLAPAVTADIQLKSYRRTRNNKDDKAALLKIAADLREQLDEHYTRSVDSTNPNVVVHHRSAGAADYVFLVNDHREYGDYVGHHELVMENGLPAEATILLNGRQGTVYDLLRHRRIETEPTEKGLKFPVQLSPGGGAIFLVTDQPIANIEADLPDEVKQGESLPIAIHVVNGQGNPLEAVIPLQVRITDPAGREAEFSGAYGAAAGQLKLNLDIAGNDRTGLWEVAIDDLASGRRFKTYFRVR